VVKPIGFVAWGPSSSQTMIVNTQCHATTTSRLKARRKSTYTFLPVPSAIVSERTRWLVAVTGVLALLGFANVMSNRVLPAALYVPWNLTVAAVVVVIARTHVSRDELGLARWRRGFAFGAVLFVATLVVLLVAVAMPAFHDLYEDRRVDDGLGAVLYQTLVRIPLGTVVLEEVAFRSVTPALFATRVGVMRASVIASALFGVWHVLPAWNLNDVNPVMTDLFGSGGGGRAAAVVFAVVGTTIAGCWWCWIRYRAGSVLATVIAHVGTNSLAYAIASVVGRS
jgi:uncharacterized protein